MVDLQPLPVVDVNTGEREPSATWLRVSRLAPQPKTRPRGMKSDCTAII